MIAIEAERISKRFGSTQALKDCSLSISSGSFFGLLGPNGAGKSTFMTIVSGFLRHDSGKLQILGQPHDTTRNPSKGTIIGFSPQSIALYKELSAEQNLRIFGKLCGLRGSMLRRRIDEALKLAQLEDRRDSQVKEFSGGMKRRLNIVASLLHQPQILLCDEPTVGVDPQSRNAIFDTLKQLNSQGMTIVYSTHYMEEAEKLCDEIAIIDHGAILRRGTLDELLSELPSKHQIGFRNGRLSQEQLAEIGQMGQLVHSKSESSLLLKPGFPLSRFYGWVENQGLDTGHFSVERASLENLFLKLTGRELRE